MAPQRRVLLAVLLLLSCCAALANGSTKGGKRVLVLVESAKVERSLSQFLDGLRGAGHELDVKDVGAAKDLALKDYDTWLYDGLFLLAPKASCESLSVVRVGCGRARRARRRWRRRQFFAVKSHNHQQPPYKNKQPLAASAPPTSWNSSTPATAS